MPVALARVWETGVAGAPCSCWRARGARRLIAASPVIGMEEGRAVLLDDAGSPLSICVPPRPSSLTGTTATVASILMRPALGEMEIAMTPSQGADYRRYALSSEAVVAPPRQAADA